MIKADLVQKRPYTLNIAISKQELTLKGEVDFRSQTNHYFYHNQGESGRLLTLPLSSYRVEEKVYVNRRVVSELRMVDLDIGSKILDNFSLKM